MLYCVNNYAAARQQLYMQQQKTTLYCVAVYYVQQQNNNCSLCSNVKQVAANNSFVSLANIIPYSSKLSWQKTLGIS